MDQSNSEIVALKPPGDIPDEQWQIAMQRFALISPIINNSPKCTIAAIARQSKIHRSTIYRWVERFQQTKSVSALIDPKRSGGEGQPRLSLDIDDIINTVISDRYLNKQKLTISQINIEVALKCREKGLKPPVYNTVRNRINAITEEQKVASRQHSSIARNMFKPVDGCFPDAHYPLAAIQIDHTPMDIIVVDDIYRKPVGKPYITLAIDVYSRMVIGFYISLDPPGALGTGLCLSHAILPKELWLSRLDVEGKWPCYGKMKAIYLDNAKEFHGKMLERACQEYDIELNYRPVATPNYGGHIERLLGTILRQVHALPGTTFSNIKDRKYYDSEGKACFTLKELEQWLATYIVNVYHNKYHKGIKTTPLAKYQQGINGTPTQIGIGKIDPIEDELKLKLDFMPIVERTIQRQGVAIDHIYYYHDSLRKWINSYDNPNARHRIKQKFAFKQDPRDISAVYFYDPHIGQYFLIPYRNTGHPSMTIWEHRRIVRDLHASGMQEVNEDMIFMAYDRLRRLEQNAVTATAVARKLKKDTRKKLAVAGSVKHQFCAKEPEYLTDSTFKYDPNEEYLPFEELIHDPFNHNR